MGKGKRIEGKETEKEKKEREGDVYIKKKKKNDLANSQKTS